MQRSSQSHSIRCAHSVPISEFDWNLFCEYLLTKPVATTTIVAVCWNFVVALFQFGWWLVCWVERSIRTIADFLLFFLANKWSSLLAAKHLDHDSASNTCALQLVDDLERLCCDFETRQHFVLPPRRPGHMCKFPVCHPQKIVCNQTKYDLINQINDKGNEVW